MKKDTASTMEQPNPFTPGVTKGMVRQHAYELYRDKLAMGEHLTIEDWVLAEKDLVQDMESDGLLK
ncbi:MAG: hypothetical protein AB1813_12425 [Verrucomicrobiota bacterium]